MSKRGWLLFLAMAVIWGIPYLLIRVAVRHLNPGELVFGRTLPAALMLLPLIASRGQLPILRKNFCVDCHLRGGGVRHPLVLDVDVGKAHHQFAHEFAHLCGTTLRGRRPTHSPNRRPHHGPTPRWASPSGPSAWRSWWAWTSMGGSIRWIGLMMLVALGYTVGPIILATKLTHVPGPWWSPARRRSSPCVGCRGASPHWPHHISGETWSCVAVLSVVCTAGAFLVFFELVKEVGSLAQRGGDVLQHRYRRGTRYRLLNEPLTAGIMVGFPLVLAGLHPGDQQPQTVTVLGEIRPTLRTSPSTTSHNFPRTVRSIVCVTPEHGAVERQCGVRHRAVDDFVDGLPHAPHCSRGRRCRCRRAEGPRSPTGLLGGELRSTLPETLRPLGRNAVEVEETSSGSAGAARTR